MRGEEWVVSTWTSVRILTLFHQPIAPGDSPPLTLQTSSPASLIPVCWGSHLPATPLSAALTASFQLPQGISVEVKLDQEQESSWGLHIAASHHLHYPHLRSRWGGCLLSQASSLKLLCFACQLALKSHAVYQCTYFLWSKVSNLINAEFQLVIKQALSLTDED